MKTLMKIDEESGAAAVEFAIVLPVLVLLLFGIIEFSIVLYDKAMITNASREGARAGIVYSFPNRVSDEEITNTILNYCGDHLITFGEASDVNTTVTRSGDSSGSPLTIRVEYRYDFFVLPNFINALAGGINLAGETVMRME